MVAKLLLAFGTDEQKDRYLPRMATGEIRATMALTEPGGGSDLQAMRTTARAGRRRLRRQRRRRPGSPTPAAPSSSRCCARPTRRADPQHRGISILLVEHGPRAHRLARPAQARLQGRGELRARPSTTSASPAAAVLGGSRGRGFAQMMKGLETGRIQVASRALGVARAALEDALRYAQDRESFGKPIWKHQSIGNYLADMATKLTAARQLILYAAARFDAGARCDMEAGMAKLFASETAMEIALTPCASTAATATRPSTTSSATSGMRR